MKKTLCLLLIAMFLASPCFAGPDLNEIDKAMKEPTYLRCPYCGYEGKITNLQYMLDKQEEFVCPNCKKASLAADCVQAYNDKQRQNRAEAAAAMKGAKP